jgi:subtilisin family serine protease
VNDAQARGDIQKCVINLSLGGGASPFLDGVVSAAVGSGMTVVIAAGNDNVYIPRGVVPDFALKR